ncbi:hypothetical protein [Rothia nasimurium]|uniref:hypothetical protein n=1 Tax=Rothia nasimurium TaxID=85336 RepID=UPI001F47C1AA|nr:hypothetical protein [Rothia nasimurium]
MTLSDGYHHICTGTSTASVTDADVRHLLWLREKAGSSVTNLVVVTTGSQAYRRQDGVAVVPLALLAE